MATILKRDSGRWQARVRKAGGRQVSRTFSTKAAAESWARAEETAIERGVWRDRTPADRITLGQLLQQYEREVVSKRDSAPVERYRVNRLREDLGHLRLSALSPAALAEWRDERLRAVASSTVLRELSTLGGALSWGIKERQLPIDNPISSIRAPSPGRSRDRRLEQREELSLLEAMEDRPRARHKGDEKRYRTGTRNGWLKPLVQLALETAMRQGELIALQWENVDLQRRVAFLPDTKNGDARSVPLSSRALEILDSLPSRAAGGRVFPVSQEAVKKAWVRTCARAGVENLRFHDLRHEATSRLAEKLPNLIELAAVTGHRDLRMLKRYYHPRAEDLALKLG